MTTPKKYLFESETCGRCGGCGRYSYNAMHGSVCYGCGGAGVRLTKRGAAAQAFFRDSLTVPAREIRVGDVIEHLVVTPGGMSGRYFLPVAEITETTLRGSSLKDGVMVPYAIPQLLLDCDKKGERWGVYAAPEAPVTKKWPEAERAAKIAAALAFQATLTKTGKPAKRAA